MSWIQIQMQMLFSSRIWTVLGLGVCIRDNLGQFIWGYTSHKFWYGPLVYILQTNQLKILFRPLLNMLYGPQIFKACFKPQITRFSRCNCLIEMGAILSFSTIVRPFCWIFLRGNNYYPLNHCKATTSVRYESSHY
jgi:hypothetical protein